MANTLTPCLLHCDCHVAPPGTNERHEDTTSADEAVYPPVNRPRRDENALTDRSTGTPCAPLGAVITRRIAAPGWSTNGCSLASLTDDSRPTDGLSSVLLVHSPLEYANVRAPPSTRSARDQPSSEQYDWYALEPDGFTHSVRLLRPHVRSASQHDPAGRSALRPMGHSDGARSEATYSEQQDGRFTVSPASARPAEPRSGATAYDSSALPLGCPGNQR